MGSDSSQTVGLAVGIPGGVILIGLLLMWLYSRRTRINEESKDNLDNIDLEGDLTFKNFEELAGPQSPRLNAGDVKRTASKKYRTYSYHPSMKTPNLPAMFDSTQSLSKNVNETSNDLSLSSNTNTQVHSDSDDSKDFKDSKDLLGTSNGAVTTENSSAVLPKRNSEQLLQNYFENVIPVVPNSSEKLNHSTENFSADVQNSEQQRQHTQEDQVNEKIQQTPQQSHLHSHSKSIFRKNKSSTAVNDSQLQMTQSNSTINQQFYIKSLNKNAMESSDFTMPIPGSGRNSYILDKFDSSTDLKKLNVEPPQKSFYIPNDETSDSELSHPPSNASTKTETKGNPFEES